MYLFHFTYTCMQIILHSADFAGDKYVTFNSSDACFFVRPDYFDHQDFLSFALTQPFHPNVFFWKVMRNAVTE